MDARRKIRCCLNVAAPAIHWLCGDIVVGMVFSEIGVAIRTGVGFMDGQSELGRVDKNGNLFARRSGPSKRRVAMALQAVIVIQVSPSADRRQNQTNKHPHSMNTPVHRGKMTWSSGYGSSVVVEFIPPVAWAESAIQVKMKGGKHIVPLGSNKVD